MIARKLFNRFLVWLGVRYTAPLQAPKRKRKPFVPCPECGGDQGVEYLLRHGHKCPLCDNRGTIPEQQRDKIHSNIMADMITENIGDTK